MKYYLIAGEASGDLHGSNLMKAISKSDPSAIFRCWGGDLMKECGGQMVRHYKDLAFMGFVEVIMNIRTIAQNIRFCKQDIQDFRPDALILIDYPGFNLRIAKFGHQKGFKVIYYISPQVWAWKKSRVYKIKKYVDKMFVILPFEKEFYAKYDYDVEFVGHPLLDLPHLKDPGYGAKDFIRDNQLSGKPIIALLPGSRKQEISKMLPVMASITTEFSDFEFAIGAAPSIEVKFYNKLTESSGIRLITGQTYDLLRNAQAALVTSGTATLETALFEVPEVVCYKGHRISFEIAKRLVNVNYISLVNLVIERQVVKELIQEDFTAANLVKELKAILTNPARARMLEDYQQLRAKLGGPGASERTALGIAKWLESS